MLMERNIINKELRGDLQQQSALTSMLQYTAKGEIATEFNELLFTKHVDHIMVFSRSEIGFAMKCGPVFRERID